MARARWPESPFSGFRCSSEGFNVLQAEVTVAPTGYGGLAMMPEIEDAVTDAVVRLPGMRVAYEGATFDESALADTWTEQLQKWLNEAVSAGIAEPNAMVLATADAEEIGRASCRERG